MSSSVAEVAFSPARTRIVAEKCVHQHVKTGAPNAETTPGRKTAADDARADGAGTIEENRLAGVVLSIDHGRSTAAAGCLADVVVAGSCRADVGVVNVASPRSSDSPQRQRPPTVRLRARRPANTF